MQAGRFRLPGECAKHQDMNFESPGLNLTCKADTINENHPGFA